MLLIPNIYEWDWYITSLRVTLVNGITTPKEAIKLSGNWLSCGNWLSDNWLSFGDWK